MSVTGRIRERGSRPGTWLVGWLAKSRLLRCALVVAGFVAYAAAFAMNYETSGLGIASLSTVPVVLTAWFFGLRAGVVASVLALPLDVLLWMLLGIDAWDLALVHGGLLGHLVLVCVGASFGWLRDLSETTRRQAVQLRRERELLAARELESGHLLQRREVMLRLARRLALESDVDGVMIGLLDEVTRAVHGLGATVFHWDEASKTLLPVRSTNPDLGVIGPFRPGIGAVGRAVERRQAVVINDYQSETRIPEGSDRSGVQAAVAAPLLHEGRLLGALAVVSTHAEQRFTRDDADLLEMLAGLASLALVGLERARLQGALLAVRTLEHELNNRLALTCGCAELLLHKPELPDALRPLAEDALLGARGAAEILERLRKVTHLQEHDWGIPGASTIDLQKSSAADRPAA